MSDALVGCGGDNDETDGTPLAAPYLTAASSDIVAHATATDLMSFGSTVMMPLDAGHERATAPASTGSGAWLPRRELTGLLKAMGGATRKGVARRLAEIDRGTTPCAVAGNSMSFEEADNNGLLDVGEVLTFVFNNCEDNSASATKGSKPGTAARINDSGTAFDAGITPSSLALKAIDGSLSLTPNDNVRIGYRALGDSEEPKKFSADGPVTTLVLIHLPCDTAKLQSGLVKDTAHDKSVGRSASTLTGAIKAAKAGGSSPCPR